jgi:hypothetical protein
MGKTNIDKKLSVNITKWTSIWKIHPPLEAGLRYSGRGQL